MTRIAILRPDPGASETLVRAGAMGLDAFALPLFELEPVEWSVPLGASFDGLLLTSANAARLARGSLDAVRQLPVHAVGRATADAARAQGLTVAATGEGGVADLLATLEPGLRLLHLAGEDRVAAAAAHGPHVEAVTVYRSRAIDQVEGAEWLPGSVALVHSPRAGRRLGELADTVGLNRSAIAVAAISPAAAAGAGSGWAAIAAANCPADEALLVLAAELCKMLDRS